MKPIHFRVLAFLALAALALVVAPPADADKQYSTASLRGAYHFTLVEITVTDDPEPETIYCNGYGRLIFDGAGLAVVEDGHGTCSDDTPAVYSAEFDYTVEPDGTVYLEEPEGGSVTHCQLADNGALLLCDGTYDPPSERQIWMATAAKL